MTWATSQKLADAGISISHTFEPGDLGRLIEIHGIQNYQDSGLSPIHEAYCAQIATEFMLNPNPERSKSSLAKKDAGGVGSFLVCCLRANIARLCLFFAPKAVRRTGRGRWPDEGSV